MTAHCTRGTSVMAAIAILLLVAAGCAASPQSTDDESDAAGVSTITSADAVALVDGDDDVVVIDVRTPDEYADGHLEGAELLDLAGGEFERHIGDYDRDTTYVLYCRTGNRSAQAATLMDELGFVDVRDAGAYDDLAASGASTASPDA